MSGAGFSHIWLHRTIPWLVVALSMLVGYQAVRPPRPATSTSATEFSATRAFEHIEQIAAEPHPMGSTANAQVRTYLIESLGALGIDAELQTVAARDYFGGTAKPVDVVNVFARIPGTDSSGTIALVAHYDTVPETPGANDNSVAVAALLESARALTAGSPLQNDVLLLFTDGEEPAPRYGANGFIANSPAFGDIELVVNLEASGGSGASFLAEINGPEQWLIGELSRADSHPAALSALTSMTRLLGDFGTDFDEFRNAGVAGFHFAYLHGSTIYHTEHDNLASVDRGSLQHQGTHALGVARHFGELDLVLPQTSSRSVYFPARPLFINYSYTAARLLALIAVVGLGFAFRDRPWRTGSRPRWRSAVSATAAFIGSITLATIAWVVLAGLRPRLGVSEGYIYFGILVGIVTYTAGRKRQRPQYGPAPATLVPWIALTVLTAVVGVGFSYLFVWPVLATAVAVSWRRINAPGANLRLAIVALPTLVVMIPPIDFLLQFAYPRPGNLDSSLPYAVLLPLLLAVMVAQLLRAFWPTAVRESQPG